MFDHPMDHPKKTEKKTQFCDKNRLKKSKWLIFIPKLSHVNFFDLSDVTDEN